jgi:ribose transport system permease protein
VPVLLALGTYAVGLVVLNRTRFGQAVYAVGGSQEAAELTGLPVARVKIALYTASSLLAAFAGILVAARSSSGLSSIGVGLELEAIAAVVIGGTSLQGGKGSIVGTVIGALIMAVLTNGLRIISVPQEWQSVAVGIVILVAVYLDMLRRRRT